MSWVAVAPHRTVHLVSGECRSRFLGMGWVKARCGMEYHPKLNRVPCEDDRLCRKCVSLAGSDRRREAA